MDSGIFKGNDLDEERAKAREEAAIAKAAGFEWVNVRVLSQASTPTTAKTALFPSSLYAKIWVQLLAVINLPVSARRGTAVCMGLINNTGPWSSVYWQYYCTG